MKRGVRTLAVLVALVTSSLLLSGCFWRQRFPPPSATMFRNGGLETRSLRVGKTGHPQTYVNAFPLADGSLVIGPVALDGRYVLEFMPLVDAERSGGSFETRLLTGDESLLVSSVEPLGRDGSLRLSDILDRTVRVDLSPFEGKVVRIEWTVSSAAGAGFLGAPKFRAADSAPRPDVLVVCSDTHRFDFSLSGEGLHLMPALQQLASRAAINTGAFSSASWTMPSIASTLTGRYPRYHLTGELVATMDEAEFRPEALPIGRFGFRTGTAYRILTTYPSGVESVAEILHSAGYTTALVAANPLYFLSGLAYDGYDLAVDTGVTRGNQVNDAVSKVLDSASPADPLFLTVHYMDVHQWKEWYFADRHPGEEPAESRPNVLDSYGAAVADADRHLATLLEHWDRTRGLEDALVVFYSDHGEHLLDPVQPNALGHGNSMAEVLLHVPLLIKLPASSRREPSRIDREAALVDVVPTIRDVLGLPVIDSEGLGQSLLRSPTERRVMFADYQLYGRSLSVSRRSAYKLVVDLDQRETALLDLRQDRGGDGAQVENEPMRRDLLDAFRRYREAARADSATLTFERTIDQEDAAERLKALGYVR